MHRDALPYWMILRLSYKAGVRWMVCVACMGEINLNIVQGTCNGKGRFEDLDSDGKVRLQPCGLTVRAALVGLLWMVWRVSGLFEVKEIS
jgi:hypothetical protein